MVDFRAPQAARIGRPLRRIRVEPKPEMPEKAPIQTPEPTKEPKREPAKTPA